MIFNVIIITNRDQQIAIFICVFYHHIFPLASSARIPYIIFMRTTHLYGLTDGSSISTISVVSRILYVSDYCKSVSWSFRF